MHPISKEKKKKKWIWGSSFVPYTCCKFVLNMNVPPFSPNCILNFSSGNFMEISQRNTEIRISRRVLQGIRVVGFLKLKKKKIY